MGNMQNTYSYVSKVDAFSKMLSQLEYFNIHVFHSSKYDKYYIVKNPNKRQYINSIKTQDCFGYTYYECYLESAINK